MKRTPLYHAHLAANARMVEFAAWEMPIQYQGISQEHLAVRQQCGIFDVSHMGEIRVEGPEALEFLRYLTLNEPAKLKVGRAQYSMLPNDQGGLIDDIYLYRHGENSYLIVCNAANIDTVYEHLRALSRNYEVGVRNESDDWALMALQGPGAAALLSRHTDDSLTGLKKNRILKRRISGCPVTLTRTGYTGEDGFEIFCAPADAEIIWNLLLEAGASLCGLGARDTLRLEAGFPLYGHELTPTTNPRCTPFTWVVKDKPFYGRDAMWDATCNSWLVGLKLTGRGIARQGYKVYKEAESVGEISSGTLSPLTKESIAMAWLTLEPHPSGTEVDIDIRGKSVPATVVDLPFYP